MTHRLHISTEASAGSPAHPLLHAAVQQVEGVAAWVCAPLRRGFEDLLRFGISPTAATELEICAWQNPSADAGPPETDAAALSAGGRTSAPPVQAPGKLAVGPD